jgi:hypothetical protein
MGPRYPIYPSQPFTGDPPSMWSAVNRASDTRYSSGTAPYFQHKLDAAHGRWLAGLGEEVQDEQVDSGFALNELRLMAEMDDIQGDGVFDNPGATPPNIHPGSGVFEARFSLPGYLARERMFAPSEVRDVTTGRPIIPVPNSPIAFDTSAQVAFIERGLNQPFAPVVNAPSRGDMPYESTVNIVQNPQPIHGLGMFAAFGDAAPVAAPAPMDGKKAMLLAGAAVVAAGGLWFLVEKARAGKRRRAGRKH